jgi:hypothetical protein
MPFYVLSMNHVINYNYGRSEHFICTELDQVELLRNPLRLLLVIAGSLCCSAPDGLRVKGHFLRSTYDLRIYLEKHQALQRLSYASHPAA